MLGQMRRAGVGFVVEAMKRAFGMSPVEGIFCGV